MLLGIVGARVLFEIVVTRYRSLLPPPSLTSTQDPESLLASGQKLAFQCADMWTLELIPGISDTLATELLKERSSILRAARHEAPEVALQRARGVGSAKGRELSRFISLESACSESELFEDFAPGD